MSVIYYAPYSFSYNYFLFLKIKILLKGKRFVNCLCSRKCRDSSSREYSKKELQEPFEIQIYRSIRLFNILNRLYI